MKPLYIAFILMALLVAGCGQSSPATPTASDIQMTFSVDPAPPSVGESTLIIKLARTDGTPIEGARLSAQGNMDHAGMEGIEANAESSSGGEYRIPFEWTMGGGWQVEVSATLPDGQTATETFSVNVGAVSQQSIINQSHNGMNMPMPTAVSGG